MPRPPDFAAHELTEAPDARFESAPADGVLPDRFYATTNLPTWVKVDGAWHAPHRLRMDAAVVRRGGELEVVEGRRVRRGELTLLGEREDGSEGILVRATTTTSSTGEFRFMATEVSRERPIDYDLLARRLVEERDRGGHIVWVAGPAVVHANAREELVWFIENGFVGALLGGNAIAAHDIERAIYGTALGVHSDGSPAPGGHSHHLRAINAVRAAGSIEAAVSSGLVRNGIFHALVTRGVPWLLAGSIRDDGPLPGVITDCLAAQDAMREHTSRATLALLIATALHAIAVGNQLPAFVGDAGERPLTTICVDQTEFIVGKLRDRGTHQAHGVVTNAQDFIGVLRARVERISTRG